MGAIVTNVHGNAITEAAGLARSTGRGPFSHSSFRYTQPPTALYAARDPCPLVIRSYTVNKLALVEHQIFISIRILFRTVLKIFYGTIVVEGVENIPQTGRPW